MKILTDKVLYAYEFIQNVSGSPVVDCDTLAELKQAYLNITGQPLSKYWRLTDVNNIPDDACVVIVRVNSEDDYTVYEDYFIRLPKKYIKRFLKNYEMPELEYNKVCCNCCHAGKENGRFFCNFGDSPKYQNTITGLDSCGEFESL